MTLGHSTKVSMNWLIAAFGCFALISCATPSLEEQFAVEAKSHCAKFINSSDQITGVAKVTCIEKALVRAGKAIEHRDLDLLRLRRDYLIALAKRVDRGETGTEAAFTLKTELELRLRAEIEHRDSRARHLQNLRDASLAVLRHDIAQWTGKL